MVRNCNVKDKDRVLSLLSYDYGSLKASTGGDFDQQRADGVGELLDHVLTTLEAMLCRLPFTNCFLSAFWFLVCDDFELPF